MVLPISCSRKMACNEYGSWHVGKVKFFLCPHHSLCDSVDGNELTVLNLTACITISGKVVRMCRKMRCSLECLYARRSEIIVPSYKTNSAKGHFATGSKCIQTTNKIVSKWSQKYLQYESISKGLGGVVAVCRSGVLS